MIPMEFGWYHLLALPAAFVLDALIGDPYWLPHPIRWMGKSIELCEPLFRRLIASERIAGLFFALFLIIGWWAGSAALLLGAHAVSPVLGFMVETVMLFYCLAVRSLVGAAKEIYHSLNEGNVDLARDQVAMIVGRDVQSYQADGIARATVETVAENFVDGVLSPLFFAMLGGGPLALAYKMVNTLDSMVGYKNDRYLDFGRAAAKIDDGVNFIPARLSVAVIGIAAALPPLGRARHAVSTAMEEGKNHSSPNAGFPEAAFAGALGMKLNGPNYYGGRLVEKPYIGLQYPPPGISHINAACRLMVVSSITGGLLCWIGMILLRT